MKNWVDKLFKDKRMILLISVAIAIISWVAVQSNSDEPRSQRITDIPIDFSTGSEISSQMELQPIGVEDLTCQVYVEAVPTVLGTITADDISVTPSLPNVTGAGTYDLPLTYRNISNKDFTITRQSPETIRVNFDRLLTRTIPIEADINGLTYPEDCLVEQEIINPSQVTLTGPEIDLASVDRCVEELDLSEPISSPKVLQGEIKLLDAEGNEVSKENISMDAETADVTIPVKRMVELPLRVEFMNVPSGFPVEELEERMTLSHETLRVAANPDIIQNYTEIHLGYIDLKTLDMSQDYTFDVTSQLPDTFTNIDNVETVLVQFDDTNIGTLDLYVDNFVLVNQPENLQATVVNARLSVRLMGDNDVLATITGNDVVAEIDLSDRTVREGQFSIPVNVYLPNKGLVWAVGDYSAVVQVTSEQQ